MSEADAFLEAIFARPDDDTPRLVYADWLEDHGQVSYGRFIRLQCEAARHKLWSPEANRLWEEIGRVWHGVREVFGFGCWEQPVELSEPCFRPNTVDAVQFHRGFLDPNLAVRFDQLAKYGGSWSPWFPTPRCTLVPQRGWEGAAARCPTLNRVRQLRLGRYHDAGDVSAFLACEYLRGLEVLDLSEYHLGDSVVEDLLDPGRFARVKELRVLIGVGRDAWFSGVREGPVPCTAVSPGSPHARLLSRFEEVQVTIEV